MIHNSITDLIGNTPIVKIKPLGGEVANLFAKLESLNAGGSLKDRVALEMVEQGEKKGLIDKNTVIMEATSGNTGIGLAMVCAAKGYKCIIGMTMDASKERRKIMRAYGAEIVLAPHGSDSANSMKLIEREAQKYKKVFICNQFKNLANPDSHHDKTAKEIMEEMGDKLDVIVIGVGTGGTLKGLGDRLKKELPNIYIVAVEPKGHPVLEKGAHGASGIHKIQGLGVNDITIHHKESKFDEVILVSDEDSYEYGKKLAKEQGIFVGMSSGAAYYAGLQLARREEFKDKNILMMLPDSGDRYLSVEDYFDM